MVQVTMISLRLLFFFFYFLVQISTPLAQPDFLERVCSNQNGNYTTNSTYEANLHTIFSSLSNLPSTAQYSGGFYNLSAGADSNDIANAIALCRGDVTPEACYSCLNDSTHELTKRCPNQKEAIGWYDYCMFRYSDNSIFGVMNTRPGLPIWSPTNVTSDVGQFNDVLSRLLNSLARTAAAGGSDRKFATGNASVTNTHTIYALVQCTPDLAQLECQNCLAEAFSEMANYFHGKVGGRILRRSCNFQYDNRVFFNTTPSTDGPGNDKTSHQSIIVIVVPIVVAVVLIICIGLGISTFLKLRQRREKVENDSKGSKAVDEVRSAESLEFEFGTIRDATNNFSDANKLGQGGFGAVYKGRLSDGQEIAVKRLSKESGQGDIEFKNEVLLVAKLQHRNLVRLLGFCLESDERLLVYEFVPNTSLDNFIFDSIKREHLNWETRYKVIGGTVRGLVYLHEDSRLRIIHRDLKASNILLDADMNPKIADFGMARLFIRDQTHGSTRRIVGTYGYMAPEYIMHGHFSVKSDVFSFGVLVLEIVSGQKNNSFRNGENVEDLLSYVWRNWKEGTAPNVIDPCLRSSSVSEMMRCIHIGLLCVQHNVDDRPTMTSIAGMLNSYTLTLPVPSQPVFFANSSMDSLNMSSSQGLSESAQSNFQELRAQ